MISENGRAFGELSIAKSRENREFTRNMILHGEKITIPVRSGTSEAILYPAAGEGPAPTIFEIYGGCFSQGYVDNNDRMRTRMHQATGYNVIDYVYAREKGIPVANVPSYGTASVGQFAIALLLEICHHIGHHNDSVHNGGWERCPDFCYWDYPLIELDGKTMGIIGFGRIGQATGKIARAMGMRVLAFDSYPNDSGRALAEYVGLDELLAQSDVIALHCPLFPETQGIVNKDTIAKMKDGVILINNSRGPLVVEQDLADALNSGKVLAAGLDVVSTEPIRADNPLLKAKNCIITPHISWAPKESRQRIMDCTVENVKAFLNGKPVNVVNA